MLIEIKRNLQGGGGGMDTQFFEAVAAKIPLFMARATISQWHQKAIHVRREAEGTESPVDECPSKTALSAITAPSVPTNDEVEEPDDDDFSPALEPQDVMGGDCSPVLEPFKNFDEEDLLDPEEDERIMRQVRETLIDAFRDNTAGGGASSSADGLDRSREDQMVAAERSKGMEQGEVAFNAAGKGNADQFHGEVALPQRNYEWEDKYRPRKPRFFNRVKTGYEWNKYNQTHYDHDNPPPKMVQGYKFNVFYPDLIDKTKAPTYYLEKDGSSGETLTLRFHAGPPYEDVAFKIVNQEWNLSHKFGFRVVFDRGVLQLYFNFKRHRYRR